MAKEKMYELRNGSKEKGSTILHILRSMTIIEERNREEAFEGCPKQLALISLGKLVYNPNYSQQLHPDCGNVLKRFGLLEHDNSLNSSVRNVAESSIGLISEGTPVIIHPAVKCLGDV